MHFITKGYVYMKDNVSRIVSDRLCVGCGVCQDICPVNCISIEHNNTNYPIVDNNACKECGKCLKVCPGKGVDLKRRAHVLFTKGEFKENTYLGRYLNCFSGYSTDYEIRYHCASGGCLSQFLIYLLDKKVIDGAVVTGFKKNSPMEPETYIARNKEEILNGKSSKYCVVSYEGILSQIKQSQGQYVMVGLPCHIHAFRKCADIDKIVTNKIIGYFSIFCSGNKTKQSQDYILYRYGVEKSRLKHFTYRDNGCLGSMFFRDKNNQDLVPPIGYLTYYQSMRSFFSIYRCGLCNDFFGELADIGFGDLNVGNEDDDPIGINSIITRSLIWENYLQDAWNEKYLSLSKLDANSMIKANKYCEVGKKGPLFYAALNINTFLFKKNPQYDNLIQVSPTIKSYIKVISAIMMRFIGKHRSLWFVIKSLENK